MFKSKKNKQSKKPTNFDSIDEDMFENPWFNELIIAFEDGQKEYFSIRRTKSGSLIPPTRYKPDVACTKLDYFKCDCCPLKSSDVDCCPAAELLEDTIFKFKNRDSFEEVRAKAIDTINRHTVVTWKLQDVGSTFVQLAVFFSGCPIGNLFKPMLKYIRPFPTNHELSKHLISRILLKHRGKIKASEDEITAILEPLRTVFHHLSKRFSDHTGSNTIPNSIVQLDAFTLSISVSFNDVTKEIAEELDWKEEE